MDIHPGSEDAVLGILHPVAEVDSSPALLQTQPPADGHPGSWQVMAATLGACTQRPGRGGQAPDSASVQPQLLRVFGK